MGTLCCCCSGNSEEPINTGPIKPVFRPPRQKEENHVRGEFRYRKPQSDIETTRKNRPMITVHYGLVAGKWDYLTDEIQPGTRLEDLTDVKRNMKTAEYMMRQVGVQTENLVILADPTIENFKKAINQLKVAINEGNEDDEYTQNAQFNFYWGGHSGVDKEKKLALCIQNAKTYPIQSVLEEIGTY